MLLLFLSFYLLSVFYVRYEKNSVLFYKSLDKTGLFFYIDISCLFILISL